MVNQLHAPNSMEIIFIVQGSVMILAAYGAYFLFHLAKWKTKLAPTWNIRY